MWNVGKDLPDKRSQRKGTETKRNETNKSGWRNKTAAGRRQRQQQQRHDNDSYNDTGGDDDGREVKVETEMEKADDEGGDEQGHITPRSGPPCRPGCPRVLPGPTMGPREIGWPDCLPRPPRRDNASTYLCVIFVSAGAGRMQKSGEGGAQPVSDRQSVMHGAAETCSLSADDVCARLWRGELPRMLQADVDRRTVHGARCRQQQQQQRDVTERGESQA